MHVDPAGDATTRRIAYFSMEIGIEAKIPTYSGGLGVLAGDMIKACADLKVPLVAVTLLYEKGYFFQRLDESGVQGADPFIWSPRYYLRLLPGKVTVQVD